MYKVETNDGEELESAFLSEPYVLHEGLTGFDEGADNTDDSSQGHLDKSNAPLREQDRFLPIANIAKIMKKSIPENSKMIQNKIAKDARECVQECVSEFISFITSEASDRCQVEKRKTINGEDILFAMSALGFDNYVEPLKLYLQKYRESAKGEKSYPTDINYDDIASEDYGASPGTSAKDNLQDSSQSDQVVFTYQDVTVDGITNTYHINQ
ncbi:nuclear transcription factor Y subunit beta [Ctenocephalides felis]|uniref:nuclear transcription factor Y subunit beta n=1 Tax=Ctenocephalides felis TaxID=7515 RepID=UPI000E6E2AB2|nr:nuclear transcription factor Y subunit beta [Ctenocephalides felis]